MTFRPTHDVGPRTQCISGLNYAAYGLPVNASRPGSPQAHASLGSGWRPTLAGWEWFPTGCRTRFRRSHHGILSPLTGLSRHTRCCVNRNWPRALPRVGSSPIDRERLWSTKLGHSIEHVARKHRFDSLRCASPTSKSIAENRLVPEERVLDAGLSMIADLLLPSTAPNLADPSDRPIASARPRVASGQLGCLRRRHDDGRASGVGCLVEGERVVGRVRRDRPRAASNGLDQIDARTRVIHRGSGQRLSDDHSRVVDSQMKLLPPPRARVVRVSPPPTHPRRPSTGQCCR